MSAIAIAVAVEGWGLYSMFFRDMGLRRRGLLCVFMVFVNIGCVPGII